MEENSIVTESCHTCFKDDSKLSVVSVMLGMTVCFSTLWRFPYQMVNFGGAAYVLVYIALAALFVYPALTAEWGLGRLTGRGPEKAFSNVNFPGKRAVPAFLFLIVLAIGSYFVVWISWILRYVFAGIFDSSLAQSATDSELYFNQNVVDQPLLQWVFAAFVVLLVAPTVLGGSRRIQSMSSKVVPIFYISVLGVAAFVLSQPGVASSTLSYFTTIDSTAVTPYTFITGLGQAFFSLCLGGTFMVLYGSYMKKSKNHNIPVNAGYTVLGNTVASLISAIFIIGVLALAGIGGNAASFGPGLFFDVIPEAFQLMTTTLNPTMVSGLMVLFFIMFFFAAYLPMTAILEVTTVMLVDTFNISRKAAFGIISALTMLLAIPSILSPLDGGFLYNLDIFVGAIGLIIGSFLTIVAFMWFVPKDIVLKEVNTDSRVKLGSKWYFWTKYVTPVFLLMIILYVLSDVVFNSASTLNGLADDDYILYEGIVKATPFFALGFAAVVGFLYKLDRNKSNKNTVTA